MKNLIKILLGLLFVSVIGVGVLYLLTIWSITPISFATAWKIVGTIAGLTAIVVLINLCAKLFFCKGNRGDQSKGNRAHPMN